MEEGARKRCSECELSPLPQSSKEVSSFQAVVLGTEVFNRILNRCPLVTYADHAAATVLLKRVFTKLQPSYSNTFLHSSNRLTQTPFYTPATVLLKCLFTQQQPSYSIAFLLRSNRLTQTPFYTAAIVVLKHHLFQGSIHLSQILYFTAAVSLKYRLVG